VCEVKFSEWTEDKVLRQPVFLKLREDKPANLVTLEKPEPTKTALQHEEKMASGSQLQLTHLDKIYWPKLKLTKGDLIEYYKMLMPVMLPYLKHRPESLHRFPGGVEEEGFFQKNITNDVPDFVDTIEIKSDVGITKYLICNNAETLLYMANLGCIEINPWNSRVESLDCPDYLVIDLDPEDLPFSEVVKVAIVVKKVLDKGEITAFCKTSGKRGMHVFIPLHGKYETDLATQFAHVIATLVHQELPEITSLERNPSNRQGKVYLDFLQNNMGQTLAGAYSPRPVPEATVSTPIAWEELNKKLDPKKFTILTVPARVKKIGDLWQDLLNTKNDLQVALKKLSL
jgi:bifunctional non-homologous end joining protein LigD